jgi:hypothetical protein
MDKYISEANHVLPSVSISFIDEPVLFKEGRQILSPFEGAEVFVHNEVSCHIVEGLDGEMQVPLNCTVDLNVRRKFLKRVRLRVLQIFDELIQLLQATPEGFRTNHRDV